MSNVIDLTEHKETIKDKPIQLIAEYTTTLEWDLEDLNIDANEIADYYIKYGILHITHKDGSTTEHDNNWGGEGDTDYKWADKETFYNDQFNEVELGI
tara:strand:+ start:569 stop:862 length:294 start_codon:yes stop_codon:yes gene_type:complete